MRQRLERDVKLVAIPGPQVEFKPFVHFKEGMGSKGNKTKLREVVTTVVAFANTQGGRIYLGINDECVLAGVNEALREWAQADLSEKAIDRYRGALTGKIRDNIVGDVELRISHTFVGEELIFVVDVSQSVSKPVTVRDDRTSYVRAGSSNQQLPPE